MWGEIAVHLHDRQLLDLAALEKAAVDASLGSLARVYKVGSVEFSIKPSVDGRWPRVKFSPQPWNQGPSWWRYAEDGMRRLPDDTISVNLEFDGQSGTPFMIEGGRTIGFMGYPQSMKVAD
jgi:hypothetical protein